MRKGDGSFHRDPGGSEAENGGAPESPQGISGLPGICSPWSPVVTFELVGAAGTG